MLRSIDVRIAEVSSANLSACYHAIRDNTLVECSENAENVFEYATYLLFQGLTNATYVQTNSTDATMNGPVVAMINTSAVDTMHIPAERCHSCLFSDFMSFRAELFLHLCPNTIGTVRASLPPVHLPRAVGATNCRLWHDTSVCLLYWWPDSPHADKDWARSEPNRVKKKIVRTVLKKA
jgi:hypothetical protein